MNSIGLLTAVVLVAAACAIVAVLVGKPPRSRQYVVRAGILGVLAGLAPISAVVFLRLSTKLCVVVNILGLPWAEPWREIAHWGAAAVWVSSTILLVVALRRPELRRAGVAMLIWSAIIALPTFLLYFIIIFGDPAGDCVPA